VTAPHAAARGSPRGDYCRAGNGFTQIKGCRAAAFLVFAKKAICNALVTQM